jgi:hypothetical protein
MTVGQSVRSAGSGVEVAVAVPVGVDSSIGDAVGVDSSIGVDSGVDPGVAVGSGSGLGSGVGVSSTSAAVGVDEPFDPHPLTPAVAAAVTAARNCRRFFFPSMPSLSDN